MSASYMRFPLGQKFDFSAYNQEYCENGFTCLPSVFSIDEVNLMRASIFQCFIEKRLGQLDSTPTKYTLQERDQVHFPDLLFWPSISNKFLENIRTDARLAGIVRNFLGDNVKQLNNQAYFHLPGAPAGFEWHQDIMFREPLDRYPHIVEENGYMQTAIIIDPFTGHNGPLVFLKGSHKFGNLQLLNRDDPSFRHAKAEKPRIVKDCENVIIRAQPGDVVIWSSLTVHKSSPNAGSHARMYLMNGFAKSANCKDWPSYLKDGVVVPLVSNDIKY